MADEIIITDESNDITITVADTVVNIIIQDTGAQGPPGVGGGGGVVIGDGVSNISTGTAIFSDANGVTFGIAGSTITASVQTNYLTAQSVQTQGTFNTTQLNDYQLSGNYLTTAMQSDAGSNFVSVSNSSLFQLTANNSLSLGTDYTTHTHNYQSTGNYLTTAMVSNAGSNFVGLNSALTANGVSATINSSGISLNVPAFLTTAMQSNAATISNIRVSAGTASNNLSAITFSNGSGVSFGLNGSVITASVAAAGGAQTGISGLSAGTTQMTSGTALFSNANGVSFGINGNTITASVAAAGGAQTGVSGISAGTTQMTSGTAVFSNSNGVSFGVNGNTITATVATNYQSQGAYLTTAALSNHSHAFATTTTNGASIIVGTSNSNGVTIGVPAYLTTAQAPGAYLTTARASNDAIGLNTALTANGVSVTANSSGLSLNFPAFLTTAAQSNHSHNFATTTTNGAVIVVATTNSNGATIAVPSFLTTAQAPGAYLTTAMLSNNGSNFVQANAGFAGTNASGTIASNGISISVNAGGGATPVASASNGSFSFTTLAFSNANNVTFGTSAGSIITASVAAPGAAAENNWAHALGANTAGNTTASGSTIGYSGINLTISGTNGSVMNFSAPATSSISATGQLSVSVNGATISMGVPGAVTFSRYNEFKESPTVVGAIGNGTLHFQPWLVPNLQMDRVVMYNQFSNATNSSGSFTLSQWVGIYTKNESTLSILTSVSMSTNFTGSGTAGSYSLYGGIRAVTMGLTTTLTEGMYWIGVIHRTTSGGANQTVSQLLISNINSSYSGILGVGSAATNQWSAGLGVYTASTSGIPNSVGFTQINGNSSVFLRPPSIYFVSGTI
jgi:hypothetical protein